ncbi:hypothetical protein F5X98DRAFT_385071 [Xylaria grammica]|nr:hypothetical protein F5X98DRAFT_385071 [Xylaria grammica]
MAEMIQAAAAAVGLAIRADLLYIYFARNYFRQYRRLAEYLDLPDTVFPTISYAEDTLVDPEEVKVDEVVESIVTSVKSATITITQTTSTLQTTTSTRTTTVTQPKYTPRTTTTIQYIETTSTRYFETTAAESSAWGSQETLTPLPYDLPDCNFPLLYMGASLLELPYNMSVQVGLDNWEPATKQLRELWHLIELHETSLLQQYGPQELNALISDLNTLVEEPLKVGCFVLQHLQGSFVELTKGRKGPVLVRRPILRTALREAEYRLEHAITDIGNERTLPAWARAAPELRSPHCLGNECLVLGASALEDFTSSIPQELLNRVKDLKTPAEYGAWLIIKAAFQKAARLYAELYEEVFVLVDLQLFALTFLIWALSFVMLLYLLRMWKYEYLPLGLNLRPRIRPGGGQRVPNNQVAGDQVANAPAVDDQALADQVLGGLALGDFVLDDQALADQLLGGLGLDDLAVGDQVLADQVLGGLGLGGQGLGGQGLGGQGLGGQGLGGQVADNQVVDNQVVDNQNNQDNQVLDNQDNQVLDNQNNQNNQNNQDNQDNQVVVDNQVVNNQNNQDNQDNQDNQNNQDNQVLDNQDNQVVNNQNNQVADNQNNQVADNQNNQVVDNQVADNQNNQVADNQNNQVVDNQVADNQNNQVVDNQVADNQNNQVADNQNNQVVDNQVADNQNNQVADNQNNQVVDNQNNQVVDNQVADNQVADNQVADNQNNQVADNQDN